jgi:hypothetical protein
VREQRWRRSDLISIGTILTVIGWIWFASAQTEKWDGVTDEVRNEHTGIAAHETRIAVLEKQQEMEQRDHELLVAIAEAVGARRK